MNETCSQDDEGFSLTELIIYVVVLGLITAGIAFTFFNVWRAQASVTDQVDASERGQLVASQIEKAVRNGVAFEVTDSALSAGLTSGPTLIVATGLTGSNGCMAFTFSGGAAQLTSTSGTRVAAPPWPRWQTSVTQHTVSGVAVPFFTKSGNSVSYSFDATSTNGPRVHFEGSAYIRTSNWGVLPGGATQTCF